MSGGDSRKGNPGQTFNMSHPYPSSSLPIHSFPVNVNKNPLAGVHFTEEQKRVVEQACSILTNQRQGAMNFTNCAYPSTGSMGVSTGPVQVAGGQFSGQSLQSQEVTSMAGYPNSVTPSIPFTLGGHGTNFSTLVFGYPSINSFSGSARSVQQDSNSTACPQQQPKPNQTQGTW